MAHPPASSRGPRFRCEPSICEPDCGDGRILGSEQCDDGNFAPWDGCGQLCEVQDGWTCFGEPSVCDPDGDCGDGVSGTAEECDDGNVVPGDGCDDACRKEAYWRCFGGEPTLCTPDCGDHVVVGPEPCDDDNHADGDGCTYKCPVEPGWTCSGSPSVCVRL